MSDLQITYDLGTPLWGLFLETLFAKRFPYTQAMAWETDVEDLVGALGSALTFYRYDREGHATVGLFIGEDRAYWLLCDEGILNVEMAAEHASILQDIYASLLRQVPEIPMHDEGVVHMSFWTRGESGSKRIVRKIEVPTWEEIASNYALETRERLHALMKWTTPAPGGQLLLWHGIPGTGKTYAIRALARAWRSWCQFDFVADPEALFGGRPDYLFSVILSDHQEEDKWRLLILEDTGELLSADAKERTGQGLSRLLNVVDGILGQGLKLLVLITTNESMGRLHPGVSRPGRCLANVAFESLTADESTQWLAQRGIEAAITTQTTVAELYGILGGYRPAPVLEKVGFHGRFHGVNHPRVEKSVTRSGPSSQPEWSKPR